MYLLYVELEDGAEVRTSSPRTEAAMAAFEAAVADPHSVRVELYMERTLRLVRSFYR
jgi:hypothetical protein